MSKRMQVCSTHIKNDAASSIIVNLPVSPARPYLQRKPAEHDAIYVHLLAPRNPLINGFRPDTKHS